MIFQQLRTVSAHEKVVIRFAGKLCSKEDSRRQYDVLVPLGTPYGKTMGHRIRRFWSYATKNGLVDSPSFGAFGRKHNPNVGSALRAVPFERRKCAGPHFFLVRCPSRSRTFRARLRPRPV